ncbi:NUDIX hydrolase [Candidatus Parcubacteria bacterium]|nr:NUDIX hydrolase [Candidatus Parcubacteria bacterium]
MTKATFTIGVFAAIFDDENRILFCHRTDYDLWNLPGGALEKKEAPWVGVIREVKEETGLDVEVMDLTHISNNPIKDDIVFLFICKIIGGKITLNDEADKIKYFAFGEIPRNTVPKHVLRLKDILEKPHKLITKTLTGKSGIELIKEGKL